MKLLVGLGNPGEKYLYTRHNAGFMLMDFVASKKEIIKSWKFDKYANADIAETKEGIILVKPQTFMNLSGKSVAELMKRYTVSDKDLIVAHDDLDFVLGDFKISMGKGPKLHNGITSIENAIKTKEFERIRIGVDNRQGAPISGETYVLSDFTQEEYQKVLTVFESIYSQKQIHIV